MGRSLVEAGVSGLTLATLIAGCTATAAEPQLTSTVPTATPHVRVEPTATPTAPPSESGKKLILPTPEPRPLSGFASLQAELMYPTTKSIEGLSYKEFMRQNGYEVFITQVIPRQDAVVIKKEGLATKVLRDTGAQDLPKDYSLKAGDRLTSINYIILAVKIGPTKKGEPKHQSWIARRVKVALGEGNPATEMWAYNQLQFVDENNIVVTFIKFINLRPTTKL